MIPIILTALLHLLMPLQCGSLPLLRVGGACGGGATVTGGWTWLQSVGATTSGNATWTVQSACGGAATSSCTFKIQSTTTGSVRAVGFESQQGDNITITSAYDCTSSSGCNSGNASDTATLCASSGCQNTNADDNVDAAYFLNGAGGATYVTVNLSGTPAGNALQYYFEEILPPLCGASRCTASLDAKTNSHAASGCGTSCTGNSMSLTATDGMINFLDTSNTVTNISLPYIVEQTGNIYGLNATSAPAFQLTTGGWYTTSELAFKSSGGSFSAPSAPFTLLGGIIGGTSSLQQGFANVNCTPTCTALTLPSAMLSGNLGFLQSLPAASGTTGTISSLSGWTVPTGANTCNNTSVNAMGCAYILSASAAGTITPTMTSSGTYDFSYFQVSRSSGSFTLDVQNSSSNSSSSNPVAGQALTMTGSVDVCFQEITWTTASPYEIGITLYPQPGGANFFGGFNPGPGNTYGVSAALLNTSSAATAPHVLLSGSATTSAAAGICFK